ERRLAEAGRAHQQHVIECLLARSRGFDEHPEIRPGLLLADELAEPLRAQRRFDDVLVAVFCANEAAGLRAHLVNSLASSFSPSRISRAASAPSPAARSTAATAVMASGWPYPRLTRAHTAAVTR